MDLQQIREIVERLNKQDIQLALIVQEANNQKNKMTCLEGKIDSVLEQVTMGKGMKKLLGTVGWIIGIAAAVVEAWRGYK
jgi:hypothetical protein